MQLKHFSMNIDQMKRPNVLRKLKTETGKRMKEPKFDGMCEATMGFSLNLWELKACLDTIAPVSEPWVIKASKNFQSIARSFSRIMETKSSFYMMGNAIFFEMEDFGFLEICFRN